MKKGSVIVDLASSTGGNVEGSKDKEVVQVNGVTIIGNSSLASKMPEDSSFLYSTNLLNFVTILIKEGELVLDKENEIIEEAQSDHEKFSAIVVKNDERLIAFMIKRIIDVKLTEAEIIPLQKPVKGVSGQILNEGKVINIISVEDEFKNKTGEDWLDPTAKEENNKAVPIKSKEAPKVKEEKPKLDIAEGFGFF